ncbi:MAG: hypothetical protein O3C28_04720 [Proteobacteria bacterium]|nr:hypothetical protein [Pseudomonadota bacterium]
MYSIPFKTGVLANTLLVIVAVILWSVPSYSATLTEHMDIECRQSERQTLDCDYRILNGAELVTSTAQYDGGFLAARDVSAVAQDSGPNAMLFLVDTSDPSRAEVIKKNRDHIRKLSQ